jgi:hypothetical protein
MSESPVGKVVTLEVFQDGKTADVTCPDCGKKTRGQVEKLADGRVQFHKLGNMECDCYAIDWEQ